MKALLKLMKVIAWVLLGLVTVVVVLLLALPLWIGPVACGVANSVVPGITKTDFKLGHFKLNPYSGYVEVGDMQLANPTNFSEKNAIDLALVSVEVAPLSLATDVIYVKDITVNGLKVHLDAPDVANFKQIAENVSGDKDAAAESATEEEVSPEEDAANEKRVVIDRIALKNVTIQYGKLPIPIPDFEIRDIGRDAETGDARGATWQEAWFSILEQISSHAEGLGKGLFKFGKGGALAVKEAATSGLTSLSNLTNSVNNNLGGTSSKTEKAIQKGMGKAMKEADKAVKFLNNFLGTGDKK